MISSPDHRPSVHIRGTPGNIYGIIAFKNKNDETDNALFENKNNWFTFRQN